jgi:uncharacterized protein
MLDGPLYFQLGSIAAWLSLIAYVALRRGRLFAMFVGIFLGVHTAISCGVVRLFGEWWPFAAYLQFTTYFHFAMLVTARLRPLWYRALVSMPGSAFLGGTLLAMPWAISNAVGFPLGFVFIPYGIAALSLWSSLASRESVVSLALTGLDAGDLARAEHGDSRVDRPLRIAQITDPHLGPFMSPARLRRIVERAVAQKPDLVLLTGDFLTMESHGALEGFKHALEPLKPLAGRTFACRGNHDFEAPETVTRGLESAGVQYLIDDAVEVDTPAGPVQVIGVDFSFRDRAKKTAAPLLAHPRKPGVLRVVMLHDPGAFQHIPDGEADLVLSGHTHGGQLGLVSLGLKATFVSLFTKIPDHGFWAKGRNRLYVHRGTGHYGFPLRVGVPGEEGIIEVHSAAAQVAASSSR